MRVSKVMTWAVLSACLVLLNGTDTFADETKKVPAKKRKESQRTYVPFQPSDAVAKPAPADTAAVTNSDTITVYENELGQTVYSIKASRFDISPPLLELAAAAASRSGNAEAESVYETAEDEHDTEPPSERSLSSRARTWVFDPVVPSVIQPGLAAPTAGFNFEGVPTDGHATSDSVGSVGNNQFVETVNSQYQVWSLNRATQTATPLFPSPVGQSALWGAGFGGLCASVDGLYTDTVVLYDKIANRWLISTVTPQSVGGTYYQCVAVSTTADATGTYARYAFAVPNAPTFFDYMKIGVWPDAYYVTGYTPSRIHYAAMDRTKMLQANPAATWIVFQEPYEARALPADVDGFAIPPRSAPGIFVAVREDQAYIYRMKVNFASPGLTTKTLQAIVPVEPYTGACGGCIPQPGTSNPLFSFGGNVMFRAAYRNYIDHESLVVTHDVNPWVNGLVAGVRWYDFRISGTPDPACPTYPCVYQQGTIADVPNGRNRWLASMAMDSAENALVGYSVTGKTVGIENHTQRYTGRAKGDPTGLMTAPETTVATGTGNNIARSYWGDYCSMSVDPFDDCTFWYVSQYFTANNVWTTRIASAAFPTGSGPGQCQPTTCISRPFSIPLSPAATVPGNNQIKVTWTGIAPQPGSYALERAQGTCAAEGLYQPIGFTSGATVTYTDTTVQGGITYTYRVRAATDAFGRCNAASTSVCANATATGVCTLKPSFAGATGAASSPGTNCGVTVSWTAASSRCPLTPSVRYNIYRGTVPDFAPAPANRIATCVLGPSSYVDTDNLQSGTTYYYAVRAEDNNTGNGGPCGNGNEDTNVAVVAATPYGAGTQAAPGTWTDGGGDGSAFLQLNPLSQDGFDDFPWRIVTTTNDPGANHTPSGAYAYRNAGPVAGSTYFASVCAEVRTPALIVAATTLNLKYWERHQLDYHRDAVGVEYSVDGGNVWTDVPAPSDSPASGCDAADDTTGWEPLSCTQDPPVNACGFPDTKTAFSGPLASGTSCGDFATSGGLTPYAHRCHQITGLAPNDTIQFRWRSSTDAVSEFAGFYLDDVAVTEVKVPNTCAPNTCVGQVNGTSCSDGNTCTVGDVCGGGLCTSGSSAGPAETQSMSAAADKATFSWAAAPSATRYDAVRGLLSALPVGPGGGDEICFADLPGPTLVDAAVPALGTGYWYLSRGENDCVGTYGTRSNGSPRNTTTCP